MKIMDEASGMTLELGEGRFSFYAGDGSGWKGMSFGLNGTLCVGFPMQLERKGDSIEAVVSMPDWEERLVFTPDWATGALVVSRAVRNTGNKPLRLETIQDGRLDAAGCVAWGGMHEYTVRMVHSDNVRTEKYPRSRPEYPWVRPVPYAPVRLDEGEGNAFPALLLTQEDYAIGLLEADLDQTRFVRRRVLGLEGPYAQDTALLRTCYAEQVLALAAEPLTLAPGEEAGVSRVFYQVLRQTHPQAAFNEYLAVLSQQHAFRGPVTPIRHGAVFCTWNYGTLAAIDERLLARRADALAKAIPECTHFLIDDGYQEDRNGRNGPLDCFYPEPAVRYDRKKFPSGMKAMADRIRQAGLEPCIWLSPSVYLDSPLARAHPDWLLCDAAGDPALLGRSTFLDVSVPHALDFFLRVLDALFVEWGFRGLKFDFMTQWFTLEKARFRNGGSGPEWRDRVFAEIRKRIGQDGFFMTCIAMSMGNPFPGRFADAYRCGCDIHDGTWSEQIKACKATFPQVLLEGRRTFLLNMDSAGFGHVPPHEQMFRLTWVFITQGLLELGGPIESMPAEQTDLLRKLCAHADRGHRVQCPDQRAFTGDAQPEILFVTYPPESLTRKRGILAHVALFNWTDAARSIGTERTRLGIPEQARMTDFWTDAPEPTEDPVSAYLPPHAARLFCVWA